MSARGFTLIELVIVVLIIGTIATIAVPRLMSASGRSQDAAIAADIATLQRAIDVYAAEHVELCPAMQPGGSISTDAAAFTQRLLAKTLITGQVSASGTFGPYLREMPVNPRNGKATIRIDGAAAGANTHGWRYDSATRVVSPDDQVPVLSGDAGETEGKDLGGAEAE